MAAQKSTKSVLDYIRQNGEKEGEDGGGGGGGKKKGKKGKGGDKEPEPLPDICDRNAVQIRYIYGRVSCLARVSFPQISPPKN